MKALFLDIDGVLNDHRPLASGYCGIQYAHALRLNRILAAEPDAKIVISSAWRYLILRGNMTVKGFEYLLMVHGVQCNNRIHGHTDADDVLEKEPSHFDTLAWSEIGLRMRGGQIRKYIEQHGVTSFVVLDDLNLSIENLVRTNGDIGLTDADAERAIEILTTPMFEAA